MPNQTSFENTQSFFAQMCQVAGPDNKDYYVVLDVSYWVETPRVIDAHNKVNPVFTTFLHIYDQDKNLLTDQQSGVIFGAAVIDDLNQFNGESHYPCEQDQIDIFLNATTPVATKATMLVDVFDNCLDIDLMVEVRKFFSENNIPLKHYRFFNSLTRAYNHIGKL